MSKLVRHKLWMEMTKSWGLKWTEADRLQEPAGLVAPRTQTSSGERSHPSLILIEQNEQRNQAIQNKEAGGSKLQGLKQYC